MQTVKAINSNMLHHLLAMNRKHACDDDCVRSARGRLLDMFVGELCNNAWDLLRRIGALYKPAKVA